MVSPEQSNAITNLSNVRQSLHSTFIGLPFTIFSSTRQPRTISRSQFFKAHSSLTSFLTSSTVFGRRLYRQSSLTVYPSHPTKYTPCAVSNPGNMPSTPQRSQLLPIPLEPEKPVISPTITPKPSTSTKSYPNKWVVVFAASIVHALHATCVYMGPATLMSPMRQSLGLTVAQITQPLIAYRIVQAIFLIPAGYLLDATGPQFSLRVSITAAALLAPLLPFVTTLPQMILLQSLFGCTKLFGGLSAMLIIITQTFQDGKGVATATSLLLSGYSFAGFLAPAVIGTLSESLGWRGAFGCLSAAFIILALPLTFYFLRERETTDKFNLTNLLNNAKERIVAFTNRSRDLEHQQTLLTSPSRSFTNQHIRRRSNDQPQQGNSSSLRTSATFTQSAKDKEPLFSFGYATVIAAVATFSFSMHIVFDHLLVFLNEDFGLRFEVATLYLSALNLIALFAKLGIGPIADRLNKSLLITIAGAIAGVASMLLLDFTGVGFGVTHSLTKVMLFIVLCKYM